MCVHDVTQCRRNWLNCIPFILRYLKTSPTNNLTLFHLHAYKYIKSTTKTNDDVMRSHKMRWFIEKLSSHDKITFAEHTHTQKSLFTYQHPLVGHKRIKLPESVMTYGKKRERQHSLCAHEVSFYCNENVRWELKEKLKLCYHPPSCVIEQSVESYRICIASCNNKLYMEQYCRKTSNTSTW